MKNELTAAMRVFLPLQDGGFVMAMVIPPDVTGQWRCVMQETEREVPEGVPMELEWNPRVHTRGASALDAFWEAMSEASNIWVLAEGNQT